MKSIIPGLYLITRPMGVNMYLIEGPDGLTLIDTSLAFAAQGVLADIQSLGRQPVDLKRILITHAHTDHVGGLPELKRITGAEVITSELERPVIEGEIPIPRPSKGLRMPVTWFKRVPVDRVVADCEVIDSLGGLQVLFTPGHAPGHIAFWQPEKKVLIAGDVLFNVFGLSLPPSFLTVDMEEDRRSVQRIAALEPDILCLGHGKPLVHDTAARLRAFARKVGAALKA